MGVSLPKSNLIFLKKCLDKWVHFKECSHYCSIYRLSYPKHLNITGRFNSLFGIDKELLNHPEKIKAYANAGIDRLVIGWE